jgi:hypothetical protein
VACAEYTIDLWSGHHETIDQRRRGKLSNWNAMVGRRVTGSSALCPCFHDLTQNGKFANVVGIMIRDDQDLAQDGVLGRMG